MYLFDYNANQPQVLSSSSSFFDSSIPQKLVQFKTTEEEVFKLEFSTDNTNFSVNPVIDIQKYYKYTFDISHFSMSDTYLDFSSSSNYNIFTEEKETSGISPGNAGAFVSIKLGFGLLFRQILIKKEKQSISKIIFILLRYLLMLILVVLS